MADKKTGLAKEFNGRVKIHPTYEWVRLVYPVLCNTGFDIVIFNINKSFYLEAS